MKTVADDLIYFEVQVSKIDLDKLKAVPIDLKKLKKVLDKNAINKTVYDQLETKLDGMEIWTWYW